LQCNCNLRQTFSSLDDALSYIDKITHNVVIKASGLAAGKGVVIPTTKDEAKTALREMMQDKVFGSAGRALFWQC